MSCHSFAINHLQQSPGVPPNNVISDTGQGPGEVYSTTSNSRHFMAVSLLRKHQIFMQALAELRYIKTGGSDARCFAAFPLAFPAVSSE